VMNNGVCNVGNAKRKTIEIGMKISSQSSEGRKRDLAVEGEAAEDVIRGKKNVRVLDE